MIGETSCGEGKQTSLLKNAFEGYISFFNGEELLVKNNTNSDVSRGISFILKIYDTRVSISNELDIKQLNGKTIVGINCNMIKKLTGTDTMITRQIYMTEMEVVNKSRPFFLLNDMPNTQGVDDAYIKRANYIRYDRSSKPNLSCDDDMFFQEDDSIDDFVKDAFIADSFIYLICKYYADSFTNKIPKPDCVIATTNEVTGYNNANSYFEDNYSFCKADDIKKYITKEKNDKGLWAVNWKEMENDKFDFFIKLDDMYTDYINSGNSCTKTEFTRRLRKQFPHVIVTVRKLYSKTVSCYVGIRKQKDDDEELNDE
jgi:phage/plasmid-associated DNA primase